MTQQWVQRTERPALALLLAALVVLFWAKAAAAFEIALRAVSPDALLVCAAAVSCAALAGILSLVFLHLIIGEPIAASTPAGLVMLAGAILWPSGARAARNSRPTDQRGGRSTGALSQEPTAAGRARAHGTE